MQTIILDDHGRAWDARSPALRSFLHCSLPDFDFLTYLVENLGFVAVTKIAPNAARIRFRRETASETSIAAALYCLVMLVMCIPSWCLVDDLLTIACNCIL